jgi:ribonuclease III
MNDVPEISRKLGHDFKQPDLLERALSHPSLMGGADAPAESYQRLEFLGDRVLGLVVAEMLLEKYPSEDEGKLTRRLAGLVRAEALTQVGLAIDIGSALRLAKSEEARGERANPAILADACEAVIAALYLDGGLDAARRFIRRFWTDMLNDTPTPPKDAKTALQEWTLARGFPVPSYREVDRTGPDHAPMFTVEVRVQGMPPISGQGPSKRQAEQRAAEDMLMKVVSERGI